MKVLLINGSPREKGCTYTALAEIAKTLNVEAIETEIFHIGNKAVQGCTACGKCLDGSRRCIFNDGVNEVLKKADEIDGLIIGSPVHYASASGTISSFLDRMFYASSGAFAYKPGASIVCARRAGTTATLDQLNKYFAISSMPVVSSQYWNMVHGNAPSDVLKDLEGMQVMRVLGRNMAWMLKCFEAGKKAGIKIPPPEPKRERTNFIRS
ncbi:MAG: flavodoxin family protein [Endomicrobium sp.]|jgi:multimeric flavodoxin WrbA|nr:flavodoxin family protein [Endomicrobium sp.]